MAESADVWHPHREGATRAAALASCRAARGLYPYLGGAFVTSTHLTSAVAAAEGASLQENPLLKLFAFAPPAKLRPLFLEQLQTLTPSGQAAAWIEQLLADPRLDSVAGAREDAVAALLELGYPWALTVAPEDLLRFRKAKDGAVPKWVRHGLIALGAVAGLAASVLCTQTADAVPGRDLAVTVAVLWAISLLIRAAVGMTGLTRWVLFREVPFFAALSVLAPLVVTWSGAAPLIWAVVPVMLTARASWRFDPERPPRTSYWRWPF